MYIISGDLIQYHEQKVQDLAHQYQDSLWQQAKLSEQLGSLTSRISSWFDGGVESVSSVDSRMEPQTVQVKSN